MVAYYRSDEPGQVVSDSLAEYMTRHGEARCLYCKDEAVWTDDDDPALRRTFPILRERFSIREARWDIWFIGPDNFIWHGLSYRMPSLDYCHRTTRAA